MSILWILGEAKSGKSELGEEIFRRLPGRKFYIATLPRTPEHAEQIRKHAERRPEDWRLIEISDDLTAATRLIGKHTADQTVAVLLDGFGVYVEERARQWARANPSLTISEEMPFVDGMYRDYVALAGVCGHLVVVDHVSPDPPARLDYELDCSRWRLREVVTRCASAADKVIYHDREDVSHDDIRFVEQVAAMLVALQGKRLANRG